MGYSYNTRTGRLCCDYCGKAEGTTRKARCPFGYCPSPAVCRECRTEHADKISVAAHRQRGCETRMKEADERATREAFMLAEGKALHCSAYGDKPGRVHVLFRRADGTCEGWYMAPEVYEHRQDGGAWLERRTPDYFRQFGELTPAPDDFPHMRALREDPQAAIAAMLRPFGGGA